ncbi:MAG: HAD family phosphatase [Ruminococcus sp.]|nr:HAD family phosphatase [Ruminococcus sp.]
MISGAVLDMDGLMIDSERIVYETWQRMMDDNGYPYDFALYKQTIGKRKNEVEKIYLKTYGADFPYWDFAAQCHDSYIERLKTVGIPTKPGLFELLDFLKAHNVKVSLATSTSRETATLNLQTSGTLPYFDALVCGNDVKNGKPHPEVFLTAAARLGLDPGDCVAYEDSLTGIESAYNAGMITIMVPDYLEPTEEVKPMISKLCKTLDESIPFLETL